LGLRSFSEAEKKQKRNTVEGEKIVEYSPMLLWFLREGGIAELEGSVPSDALDKSVQAELRGLVERGKRGKLDNDQGGGVSAKRKGYDTPLGLSAQKEGRGGERTGNR